MKNLLKQLLKRLKIYYRLQYLYRHSIISIQQFFLRIQYKKFKGKGFVCNFCGASYSKFIPEYPSSQDEAALSKYNVVAGYGDNVFCPNCFSTNRERLILAIFENKIEVDKKLILHFAPEQKIYNRFAKRSTIITADIETGFYKVIDKNIRCENITALSFNDNYFDIVIANHVLEHVPEDVIAMKELYRVLKKDGIAVLQVPFSTDILQTIEDKNVNDPELQSALFGQKDHVRIYNLQDYINRLKSVGFSLKYLSAMDLSEFEKYAIQKNEGFLMITK